MIAARIRPAAIAAVAAAIVSTSCSAQTGGGSATSSAAVTASATAMAGATRSATLAATPSPVLSPTSIPGLEDWSFVNQAGADVVYTNDDPDVTLTVEGLTIEPVTAKADCTEG